MKKQLTIFAFLLLLLAAGCKPSSTQMVVPTQAGQTVLSPSPLKTYSSTFMIQFDGPTPWKYELKTLKSKKLLEMSLHIEGISGAKNPGDIRLVTDGATSWMIGPGTDQECVQFPNNKGMDPSWIFPETLISSPEMSRLFTYDGQEPITGMNSLHYKASSQLVDGWQDARVEVWQEKASRILLQMTLQGAGEDPFFGTGAGKINARYQVTGTNEPAIEPVKGCEISIPLPDGATNFVRLPGMASFDSPSSIEEIRGFYQDRLPKAKWTEKDPAAQSGSAIVLGFQRGAEIVEIHIEAYETGGSSVKLMFDKVK